MNELDHRDEAGTMAEALTAAAWSLGSLSRAGRPLRLRFAAPRAPAGSLALTVTVARDAHGFHMVAQPELCLDADADQRQRFDLLDGFTVEARGRDAETAVDLLLEDVDHYLRPLVDWAAGEA